MTKIRIFRGTIKDIVATAGKVTRCTVVGIDAEEIIEDAEIFENYGNGSAPPAGTECIALQFCGQTVVVATADADTAIDRTAGEVELHVDDEHYFRIKKSGAVELKTTGGVNIDATQINLGGGAVRALVDERLIELFNAHTHAVSGGTTLVPSSLITALTPCTTDVVKGE